MEDDGSLLHFLGRRRRRQSRGQSSSSFARQLLTCTTRQRDSYLSKCWGTGVSTEILLERARSAEMALWRMLWRINDAQTAHRISTLDLIDQLIDRHDSARHCDLDVDETVNGADAAEGAPRIRASSTRGTGPLDKLRAHALMEYNERQDDRGEERDSAGDDAGDDPSLLHPHSRLFSLNFAPSLVSLLARHAPLRLDSKRRERERERERERIHDAYACLTHSKTTR